MTKTELVKNVAEKAGVTKKEAGQVLAAFLETVIDAMKEDDKVQLAGFGTFETVHRDGGIRRNPRTGESMEVPAYRVPKLKFSSTVKAQFKS